MPGDTGGSGCYHGAVSLDPAPRRLRAFAAGACALALLAGAAWLHAQARRAEARQAWPAQRAIVRATGLPDLALSSTARWLRHPTQVEPAAAVQDTPGGIDTDPAGALLGPPFGSPAVLGPLP